MTLVRHRRDALFRRRIWRLTGVGLSSPMSGNSRNRRGGLISPGVAARPITRMEIAIRRTFLRLSDYTSTWTLLIPAILLTADGPNDHDVFRLSSIRRRDFVEPERDEEPASAQ